MGSKVIFSRAPRGDATQAPPPVGPAGQLGTSDRAAREDHTHEGVHKLVAGSGIALDPASGLGDVTVETLHWRPPVSTAADLPTTGNQDGDARVVLNEAAIYIWSAATGAWQKVSGGSSGGGGSTGGFVLEERLNHLLGQIRVSQLHGLSRFEMYSEFVDDFNDSAGIMPSSSGYALSNSRVSVSGEPTWHGIAPSGVPPARYDHAMAYDASRGVVVMFGGIGTTRPDDTWEWDGANWVQKAPATRPMGRNGHAMAYDASRGVVVMFGGYNFTSRLNDTWEWDGANWVQKAPATRPMGRNGHAMAYDASRGVVVMFGGYNTASLNDTWEWDGANWVQKAPATKPPARSRHAMAYDASRGVVVMFGGYSTAALDDTWEWDGANWVQKAPATKPPARYAHAMAYDASRGVVVMFGGFNGTSRLNDTWEWDGANWVQKAPATKPPARSHHAMAYDASRGAVVMFGGSGTVSLDDTWEYFIDGSATVMLRPMNLPFVPIRGYLTCVGSASQFALSRDGGNTFTPVSNNGAVDLSSQPSGTLLVAKINLQGSQFVDAIGVGASSV